MPNDIISNNSAILWRFFDKAINPRIDKRCIRRDASDSWVIRAFAGGKDSRFVIRIAVERV